MGFGLVPFRTQKQYTAWYATDCNPQTYESQIPKKTNKSPNVIKAAAINRRNVKEHDVCFIETREILIICT